MILSWRRHCSPAPSSFFPRIGSRPVNSSLRRWYPARPGPVEALNGRALIYFWLGQIFLGPAILGLVLRDAGPVRMYILTNNFTFPSITSVSIKTYSIFFKKKLSPTKKKKNCTACYLSYSKIKICRSIFNILKFYNLIFSFHVL